MSSAPRTFSWLTFVRFLVLLLFVLPTPADESSGGGEGGIINLPGSRDRNGLGGPLMRVTREDMRVGAILHMPIGMNTGIAFVSHQAGSVQFAIVDGYLTLSGTMLTALRDQRVTTFHIDIFDGRDTIFGIDFELQTDNYGFIVTVW